MLVAVGGLCAVAMAERPNKPREELVKEATQAFTGRVERLYHAAPVKEGEFEFTHGVAEMTVASVEKGTDLRAGDRVFVRHWRKRWVGRGSPPPDHYGHRTVPAEKQSVAVFVTGTRETGYDVLSPNGYFEVVKAGAK
jgi:hypothetical protein